MRTTPFILIVDDDAELAHMLREYLEGHNFQASVASHAGEMADIIAKQRPDLILLDMMLPGEDGLSIARRLASTLPIVMMSARAGEADRIAGIELGAQDFVSKPFSPRELLARIRGVLRRQTMPDDANSQRAFGAFQLDLARRVLLCNGALIPLSAAEFSLLRVLVTAPFRVLTRDDLLGLAQKLGEHLPFDRSIDARVVRLRRKIEPDPSHPRYLRTVRGLGYLFSPDGDGQ